MKRTDWLRILAAFLIPATCALGQGANLGNALQDSYEAEKKQDYQSAIKPLEQLGTEANTSYIAQLRLGWLYYCAKDWNQSVAHYTKAVQIAPTAIEPLFGLMLPLQAAGKNDDALRIAQTVLRTDPNNYTALSRTAWLLYLKGDYQAAVTPYRKLVSLYPTDTEMLLGLGFALKLAGEVRESAKHFQTVLLLSPDNSRALDGLKTEQAPAGGGPRGPMRVMMQEPPHEQGHRPNH